MSWHNLNFCENDNDNDLKITLTCGQAFRWQLINNEWCCAFESFVVRLKQIDRQILFYSSNENYAKINNFLSDYFRCSYDLASKVKKWSCDEQFLKISKGFRGVRLLRQCPIENLFSFICSSNNNVPRITGLVHKLAFHFGAKQSFIDESGTSHTLHSFPTIKDLCQDNVEVKLRDLGFGYRARYIKETVYKLNEFGYDKLINLRNESYEDAKKFLIQLSGVGSKIADCVLLGSLDKLDAVPIDIHMFNIAKEYYSHLLDPSILKVKSISDRVYSEIQNVYIRTWCPDAGWAQLIIFAADLKLIKTGNNLRAKKRKSKDD